MQITHYLASENFPIHTSHFDPRGLRCVHLLRTNCEQTKTQCQARHFAATVSSCCPECRCLSSFTQKRGTRFKEIQYSFEWAKKSPSQDTGESHICSSDVLAKQSNTIPLQNQCMDLESNEYHNTCKGKVSKCTWRAQTLSYCTLIYTKSEFLRTTRTCREVPYAVSNLKKCAHHHFCFP
jgi:hypothetical protein